MARRYETPVSGLNGWFRHEGGVKHVRAGFRAPRQSARALGDDPGQVAVQQALGNRASLRPDRREGLPDRAARPGPAQAATARVRLSGHCRKGGPNIVSNPPVKKRKWATASWRRAISSASVAGPDTRRSSRPRGRLPSPSRSRTVQQAPLPAAARKAARQFEVAPRGHVDLHQPRGTGPAAAGAEAAMIPFA